jgi:hypothetical protein
MTVDEEMKFVKELREKTIRSIDDTYDNMFKCEDTMDELFKVVPFVFSKEQFFSFMEDYNKFEVISGRFEMSVVNSCMIESIEDVMDINNAIQEIRIMFGVLNVWLRKANSIIEAKQFDVNKYLLVERINSKTRLEYDTIDFNELEDAFNGTYLVIGISDVLETKHQRDNRYGILRVLTIKNFSNKVEANKYALANGISRDYVISRF